MEEGLGKRLGVRVLGGVGFWEGFKWEGGEEEEVVALEKEHFRMLEMSLSLSGTGVFG